MKSPKSAVNLVVFTSLATYLARVFWVLSQPTVETVKHLPDDAFYYLVLARRMATTGAWTFDGSSPATGFHPLHTALMVSVEHISVGAPLWQQIAVVGSLSALALAIGAFYLSSVLASRTGTLGVLAGGAVLCAPIVVSEVTWLMEAPWVLLATALTFSVVFDGAGRRGLLLAFLVGVFGSMARTDFGLFPFALVAGLSLLRADRTQRWRALVCVVGAALGLMVFLVQVHDVSGSWIQSSAQMKSFWSEVYGYVPHKYLILPAKLLIAPGVLGILGIVLIQRFRARSEAVEDRKSDLSADAFRLAGLSLTIVAAYLMLYGHNSSAVQPWYIAPFIAPVVIVVGVTIGALGRGPSTLTLRLSAGVLVLGAVASFTIATAPVWRHQANMMSAGRWLRDHPQPGTVAAFNAGLISYFSGADVVNIDGLVNDDIYEYASQDRLVDYLVERDIRFVLDYPAMWTLENYERRGGYTNGALRRRLQLSSPVTVVESQSWEGNHPALYSFHPEVVESEE